MSMEQKIKGSTRDYSYQLLRNKIMHLEIEPGTKISEKEIANELNVSRTPVREAFMKLAEEELLDIIPQSGTIVSRINLRHVEEGRFIREKIEKEIVALACGQFGDDFRFRMEANIAMQEVCASQNNVCKLYELDEEFHQILFEASGKQRTWKMLQQLNIHFNRSGCCVCRRTPTGSISSSSIKKCTSSSYGRRRSKPCKSWKTICGLS